MLLSGELGFGKTRLMVEFCDHAPSSTIAIRDNCCEGEASGLFDPLGEALRSLIDQTPDTKLRETRGPGEVRGGNRRTRPRSGSVLVPGEPGVAIYVQVLELRKSLDNAKAVGGTTVLEPFGVPGRQVDHRASPTGRNTNRGFAAVGYSTSATA